ncbi:hypothetical protein M4951_08315 [Blastopirellula sp. J2-11]|uniref:hypothetical protein n=1 Tax=Blastopirellula sp. J2-11 TaxID=2943192 RepID=UPI0021C577EE|nr:hypothetical protein [Blastopirellula sp. J2-11]UUO08305.1 hypothetical protein M4951_08315 [Blastopirellula sp. J2-11]
MSNRKKTSPKSCGPRHPKSGDCQQRLKDTNLDTYAAIVRHYLKHYQSGADKEIRFYEQLPSWDKALRRASFAETPQGRRHPHQYRLKRVNLQKVHARLRRRNLAACETFHELFLLVEEAILSISGIGELMVYDTAHRLGAFLRLSPEFVYLHAGVRVGAVALGLEGSRKWIEPGDLPRTFRRLTPQQIEDCLCIYKHDLQAILAKQK